MSVRCTASWSGSSATSRSAVCTAASCRRRRAGGREAREHLQGQLAEALTLGEQPILERRLGEGESGEEIALIEAAAAGEASWAPEPRPARRRPRRWRRRGSSATPSASRRSQSRPAAPTARRSRKIAWRRLARACAAEVSPQEAGELVARVPGRGHCQVSDKASALRVGNREPARIEPGAKAAEELQPEAHHRHPLRLRRRIPLSRLL